ncbi:hypothetical protein APS67_006648 [Streptomyces sp. AVP053U2]|nr:hypothetical protein APS67_006648 [Streptomyces sp. AVP053U2]
MAAARLARPAVPTVPATEEQSTNAVRSRSRVSSSRWTAGTVRARCSAANRSGVRSSSTPSSTMPAACTTPVSGVSSGMPASTAARASRSAASQAATVTSAPSSRSSATSSAAPGASGPRRPTSTRRAVPAAASQRATWAPRPPVPPVTRTVPLGSQPASGAASGAGTSRRPKTAESRTATWSSPSCPARTVANRRAARSSRAAGRSINPPHRTGSSSAATRPRPHTAAWPGAVGRSVPATATAPRVTHHRGTVISASSRAWSSTAVGAAGLSAVSVSASRDSTPVSAVPSESRPHSLPVSASRSSVPTVSGTTSVPTAARTAATHSSSASASGRTASQVPVAVGAVDGSDSGFHVSWCLMPSTIAWSRCLRRQVDRAGRTAPSASVSTARSVASVVRSSPSTAVQNAVSRRSAPVPPAVERWASGQ